MHVTIPILSTFLRRFPLESGRWRLIPYALKLCQSQVVEPTIRTIRTRHGFRMRVDVSEWLGRHIFVTGEYEPATTNVVAGCLKPGMSFIDVGANAGYFSLLAARCIGLSGQIRSFEPLPEVRQALEQNLQLNRVANCETFDVALSNVTGQASLFAGPKSHLGMTSLRPLETCNDQTTITTARLDDLLPDGATVDLVKIDVEGAECHVLEGMQRTIERCLPDIVLEVTPTYLQEMGRSASDISKVVSPFGYRSYAIDHDGLRPLSSLSDPSEFQFNAFLTTREAVVPTVS